MEKILQLKLLGGVIILFHTLLLLVSDLISPVPYNVIYLIIVIVFVFLFLRLLLVKKKMRLLSLFAQKYPRFSAYLSAIGWVEYLTWMVVSIIYLIWGDSIQIVDGLELLLFYTLVLLSLFVCFLRRTKMQALDSGKMSE